MTDIIWAIWKLPIADPIFFDKGVEMTRLALKHGCDIEETVYFNEYYVLSAVNAWSWSEAPPMLPIETLRFLLDIGYNIEQQSTNGLTSLHFAATQHVPHIIKCLRLFIERGANPHAIDFEGRGVLHCAMAAPEICTNWCTLYDRFSTNWCTLYDRYPASSAVWAAPDVYNTEDRGHKEDYDDEGIDTELVSGEGMDNSYYKADEYSIDYIFCKGPSYHEADDHSTGYIFYEGPRKIRNPLQVLKKRTMFKLLTLLQLGCDPNVLDNNGQSPSDYAMRDGIWPQWRWALLNAGYVHHRQHGWVKSSVTASA